MDDFHKFLSLTDSQRSRIVKAAKRIDRMSGGQISFDMCISVLTGAQFAKNEQEIKNRREMHTMR